MTAVETDAHFDGGAGSTLVLLHGMGNTWRAWKPVLPHLLRHHRVLAVTLPGHHGGPEMPDPATLSIATMADAVLAQLKGHGLESAHVAGNSLGGWLALELHRRGFAKSVTALSPAGASIDPADTNRVANQVLTSYALARHPTVQAVAVSMGWVLYSPLVRRLLMSRAMKRGDLMTADELKAAIVAMPNTHVLPGLIAAAQRDGSIDPIPHTDVPIRIAWAQHDLVVPFDRHGKPMLERVPSAEHVTLRGVGHVPMHDDPQAVARTILEVTNRRPASKMSPDQHARA